MFLNYLKVMLRNLMRNKVYAFLNLLGLTTGLIAIPISFYAMNQWLTNFEYHIAIGFPHFIWTLLIMLIIAISTVGFRIFKTATSNPVEALAQE